MFFTAFGNGELPGGGEVKKPPEAPVAKRGKNKNATPVTTTVEKTPDSELRAALGSLYARTELPVAVSVGYTDAPGAGTILTAVVQIDTEQPEPSVTNTAPQTNVADVSN